MKHLFLIGTLIGFLGFIGCERVNDMLPEESYVIVFDKEETDEDGIVSDYLIRENKEGEQIHTNIPKDVIMGITTQENEE